MGQVFGSPYNLFRENVYLLAHIHISWLKLILKHTKLTHFKAKHCLRVQSTYNQRRFQVVFVKISGHTLNSWTIQKQPSYSVQSPTVYRVVMQLNSWLVSHCYIFLLSKNWTRLWSESGSWMLLVNQKKSNSCTSVRSKSMQSHRLTSKMKVGWRGRLTDKL